MRRSGLIWGVIWAVLLALALLRASVISLQPLPLLPGDPARLLAVNPAPPEITLQGWLLALAAGGCGLTEGLGCWRLRGSLRAWAVGG